MIKLYSAEQNTDHLRFILKKLWLPNFYIKQKPKQKILRIT